ncbi:helix-turn-helix domain-containing protein [Streptomyces polyrhachis]|uniref:Helix-turn-helix domain-containing protein n=1 Tax=Streptomyces polyrhachis TaxID=1282885 RepID=A0ABW2GIH1_9ACTN
MSLGTPSADDRTSVGRTLQHARIDAGLTVEQVSAQTRVRTPILHAIEDDDFSRCGGEVYARGHVRNIARLVGLDPDLVVAQFDAERGGRPEPVTAAPLFEAERMRPEPRRPNWTAAMVAAIVAVIGFVGFTVFSGDDGAKDTPTAVDTADDKADGKSGADPSGKPSAEPTESAIAQAPADKVTVKLVATDGKSWISAKGHDGSTLEETVLQQGDSVTVQDDQRVNLILGNAGAVQLFVNGKEVDNDFQLGQVERISYTKGDPEVG